MEDHHSTDNLDLNPPTPEKKLRHIATSTTTGRPIYRYVTLTKKDAPHLTNEQRAMRSLWLNALFSETYNQATGVLREAKENPQEEGFCCIGVACDLSGKGEWVDKGYEHKMFRVLGASTMFKMWDSAAVWELFGLKHREINLAVMNDGSGKDEIDDRREIFSQSEKSASDWIEQYHFKSKATHPEIAMAIYFMTLVGVM